MGLYDGPRQILAGGLAAVVFLGLFFGVHLVWWLALILGAVAYGALLLIIPKRLRDTEIAMTANVTKADLEQAAASLESHA